MYLVYAESTGELISFGFSDHSVLCKFGLSELLNNSPSPSEKRFTFWLIFGLSPNLGLRERLSERLIQKVK